MFPQTDAEKKHFPLPHSTVDFSTQTYDPTYGDQTCVPSTFAKCQTCKVFVELGDEKDHADWHERETS